MEAKHTPGPWRVHDYDFDTANGTKITTDDVGRNVIAEVKNPADATLIAAAPDMLEALRAIAETFANVQTYPHTLDLLPVIARQAIEKAEGR